MKTLYLLEETPATSPATNSQPRNLRTLEKPEIVAELEVAHGNPAKPHSLTQRRWCYPDDGSNRDLRIDFIRGMVLFILVIVHVDFFSLYNFVARTDPGLEFISRHYPVRGDFRA